MSLMPDPLDALKSLQQEVDGGMSVNLCELDEDYKMIYDEPGDKKRFSYAKIVDGKVQALSIFAIAEPIDGVPCFNIGYAVEQNNRGCGLGVEAVNKGIDELKNGFGRTKMESFYLEAIVEETNKPSIKVAEKLFSCSGKAIIDQYTGKSALYFKRLVVI